MTMNFIKTGLAQNAQNKAYRQNSTEVQRGDHNAVMVVLRKSCVSALLLGLMACSALAPAPPELKPTTVPSAVFEVVAATDLNPDRTGKAKPVLLRLYELRAAASFERAGFLDLLDKDEAQLGGDFVRREAFLLQPGERRVIERKGDASVQTFGWFAAYRDLERSNWRSSVAAPNSVEMRRRWWGLGPTERVKPVRYVVNVTRSAVRVAVLASGSGPAASAAAAPQAASAASAATSRKPSMSQPLKLPQTEQLQQQLQLLNK